MFEFEGGDNEPEQKGVPKFPLKESAAVVLPTVTIFDHQATSCDVAVIAVADRPSDEPFPWATVLKAANSQDIRRMLIPECICAFNDPVQTEPLQAAQGEVREHLLEMITMIN